MRLVCLMLCIPLFSHLPFMLHAYKNYTVGDSLGWYDALENPKVDYQKWAAADAKNFTLVFNTDNNHSVIQTYNATIYNLCDYSDAPDNATIEWSLADPSSTTPRPLSVPVPLVRVGTTYFFSSDYDGEQCRNGQHFKINVTYGRGLPPSPSGDSPGPVGPLAGDDESAPETLVPTNFDHPRDVSDDSESDESKSVSLTEFFRVRLHGIMLVVVVYLCL